VNPHLDDYEAFYCHPMRLAGQAGIRYAAPYKGVLRMIRPAEDSDISVILFNASTVMVGVCLTVIGILHLDPHIRRMITIGDFLLTAASILFLISGIVSYLCLRNRKKHRRYSWEKVAEIMFTLSMTLVVFICLMLEFVFF
jgi:hypothetical protein